jgi:sulfide dehydrogenase cytochrome subunit
MPEFLSVFPPRQAGRPVAALALAVAAAIGPARAQDASAPAGGAAWVAQECISCHDTAAVGRRIPPLWGLDPERFIAAMEAFRAGTRDNPAMVSVARGLSPELIAQLARYFAQGPRN